MFGRRPIDLAADRSYLHFEVKDGCTEAYARKESRLANYYFTLETFVQYTMAG